MKGPILEAQGYLASASRRMLPSGSGPKQVGRYLESPSKSEGGRDLDDAFKVSARGLAKSEDTRRESRSTVG